ncbi:Di-copper centre-containing protein [Lindgomyces ingoldianus]|uniref:Di-copper centre-containing protein n=1 Tax=Lindgomyces ingoldianus TaxID=673940 RepID=A0ACB6QHH6_9PLEO|nr:Di-copper centre-containing protein [Lindgomyces ingoldianus]KAF2466428.1 Di-copper centre-containing protein [Lindgomyces ingoldianus]
MANPRITATGITTTLGPNGSLPLRREIRDLQANFKDQFNLYLLGLVDLQKKPVKELLSYYQLAGIHGEPYVAWNGVTGNPNARFGGYCTHSSILFLTWHRPYLALYEQALYASVQKVAGQFAEPLRTRYLAAAKDFRLPYWDWAARITRGTSAFPAAVSSSTIKVIDVDGVEKPINNPLYSFRFNDKAIPTELALDSRWRQFPNTKRAPDSSGNSQNGVVSQVITNENESLRTNVSLILLSYTHFDAFSNNAWLEDEDAGAYGSLEDLHGEIHDKVGEGGHMGSLAVSAFDPVFWMHHTNVDRLWAIWQALHPNAYVIDKVSQAAEANFTISAGARISGTTDLKPWYDSSATKFWNSNGVKYTTPFGHAYPETQRWLYPNDQAYQAAVTNEVVRQYGANRITSFFTNLAASAAPPKEASTAAASKQTPVATASVANKFAHLVPNRMYTEWITNLRTLKHGLNQTFRVFVFLGDFNPDPKTWPTEFNVVGRFTVLGRGDDTPCEKCQQDQESELVITGTVPLTSALLQDIVAGQLASLEPADVEGYLERNLHWRVTLFDGSEKPREEVPGLKVSVVSTKVRIGDDGIPVYSGVYDTHPGITDGRPAGLTPGDRV